MSSFSRDDFQFTACLQPLEKVEELVTGNGALVGFAGRSCMSLILNSLSPEKIEDGRRSTSSNTRSSTHDSRSNPADAL